MNDRGRLEDNIGRYKVGRDWIEGDWIEKDWGNGGLRRIGGGDL